MTYGLGLQSAPPPDESEITCGAFFPAVFVRPFYDDYRVPAEIPPGQVRAHLRSAIARCIAGLKAYRDTAIAAGYASLTSIPAEEIDGEHEKAQHWRRAVYCEAKAEILKETQTVSQREKARNDAKAGEETEDKYREFAATALRLIADMPRIEVDLL